MVKVLIFGTGAVGSVYGWILHNAGAEVTVVCRTNYATVKEKGLLIRSGVFGKVHYKPTTVDSVSAAKGPFDFILVCSKAFPGTSGLIREAVSADTAIVLAQNGICIEDEYAESYPGNVIISAVVYLPVTQVEPGVIEMGLLERFEVGTYPATAPAEAKAKVKLLQELWSAGGATCKVFDDVQTQRWVKLAVNAAWNPMCALTLCDDANLLRSSLEALGMVKKVMMEVGNVAKAAGYPVVTEEELDGQLSRSKERLKSGGKEPSMLTDIRNHRPIEVEAILGNTVRIAQRLRVDVPYLEILYTLAKGLDFSTVRPMEWKPLATF
ncbi:2-dehydropantoate 2-reductase [Phialemonium atrogriseum]|uniref:2-dehydropantoate 2-reductase n=1 Tax=Phialemonium atrogriseum TaxID=1093897 RepID=A0AAJ0BVW4_9PEZI|nr:2-dehydropantoate 2-reductase [Phialemonium atrogriseum]KAK1765265.1 2-dehydropantoate 2-reductase [Phialemonium atrogriseum]